MTDLFAPPSTPSLRRPVATLRVAGETLDVVAAVVELGLAPATNAAALTVPATAALPEPGAALTLALGSRDDGVETVLTGVVARVRRGTAGTARLDGLDGGALLAGLRVDASFEQQRLADVVTDVCGRAGATPGSLASGPTHPFLALHGARGAWRQLAELAAHDGHLLAVDAEGRVVLTAPTPAAVGLRAAAGVDAALLEVERAQPGVAPGVVGEGAAGTNGSEAWPWLVADPTSIRSGGQAPVRSAPALRTPAAVETAATALSERVADAARRGRLRVALAPAVRPGTAVAVTTADGEELQGLAQAVSHDLRGGRAATTTIWLSGVRP